MTGRNADEQQFDAAVAAITSAYEDAAKSIGDNENARLAFSQATELVEQLRRLTDAAAAVRAQAVGRIWSTEEMSLATLAQHIGVSKARADQLVRAAKASDQRKDTDDDE